MAFYSFVTPAVYWVTGSERQRAAPTKVAVPAGPKKVLTADEVVAVARARAPGTELYRLYPPKGADAPYRVFVPPAHDRQTRFEETRLVVDPYTGAVLHEEGPRTMSAGDRALRWLLPLHFGTFGGTATQVIYLVVSLGPVLLSVTGFFIWRKRARARRAASQVRTAAESSAPPAVVSRTEPPAASVGEPP